MELLILLSLIIWITGCLILFFFGATDKKSLVKFIGGFSVALVAIYANNPWVYFISVAITGLIIASERFMSILVALIRGNSDLWNHDSFWKAIEKMSPDEIENKTKQDVEEIKEAIVEEITPKARLNERNIRDKEFKKYIEHTPEIERKALLKFQKLNGVTIKEQVKIGQLLLDGVGISKKGNKLYLFEVKVIPDKSKNISDGNLAENIFHILRRTIPSLFLSIERNIIHEQYGDFDNITLMMIIVVDSDRNLDNIMEKVSEIKSAYNDSQNNIVVRFTFYNSSKL